ncbi:MAG: DoxX family protein [Anaerolineales bacterium]|nr:DoxX family protein [Anaerolineales bacterium]
MLENIFLPYSDWGLFILRLAMGIIFLVHGWPKLNPNSEMKGPAGFGGFLKQMGVPLPIFFGWVVALLETVGAVLLILGLGTRVLAVLFAINMLVATFTKRRVMKIGFTSQQATGWEFDFALLAISLALLFTGSGSIALDPVLGL